MFELELKEGNVIKIYKVKKEKAIIEYNGMNFDLETMIFLLDDKMRNSFSVSEEEIAEFENDPEMRRMVENSQQDIKNQKVYSTDEVIKKIRRGEI